MPMKTNMLIETETQVRSPDGRASVPLWDRINNDSWVIAYGIRLRSHFRRWQAIFKGIGI